MFIEKWWLTLPGRSKFINTISPDLSPRIRTLVMTVNADGQTSSIWTSLTCVVDHQRIEVTGTHVLSTCVYEENSWCNRVTSFTYKVWSCTRVNVRVVVSILVVKPLDVTQRCNEIQMGLEKYALIICQVLWKEETRWDRESKILQRKLVIRDIKIL